MIAPEVFDDLRPYNDEEVTEVFRRVVKEPKFMLVMKYLWPEKSNEELLAIGASINSTAALQNTA